MMTNQKNNKSTAASSILTTWELINYDVWGNEKEGYKVNQAFRGGSVEMRIPQTRRNAGTPQEYISAYPTPRQIKRACDILPRVRLELDGDDLTIYVNRRRDGYPICELHCTSHESLSPVRAIAEVK